VVNLREDYWQPLIYYRASLLASAPAGEGEDVASYVSSDRRPYPANRSLYGKLHTWSENILLDNLPHSGTPRRLLAY